MIFLQSTSHFWSKTIRKTNTKMLILALEAKHCNATSLNIAIFSFYCRISLFELVQITAWQRNFWVIRWHVPIVQKLFWNLQWLRNIFEHILEKNHLNVTFVAKNFLRKAIVTHILENITPILISIRKRIVNKLLTLDFLDLV